MSDQPASTASQPTAVATQTESRPTGAPNGIRREPSQPTRMNANATSPIHGACHICAAGRMAMNAIEMPASEPSIAARGVHRRIHGPTSAPHSTITPMMNAQASPACQAWIGSPVRSCTGSITTKTTMNMCGTEGP